MSLGYEKFVSDEELQQGPYCRVDDNDDATTTTDIFNINGAMFDTLWLYQPSERKGYVRILGQESYRQLMLTRGVIGQPPVFTHEYAADDDDTLLFSFPWQTTRFNRASFEALRAAVLRDPSTWSDDTCHALQLMGVYLDRTHALNALAEYGPRGIHALLEFNQMPLRVVDPTAQDVARFIRLYPAHPVPYMWYAADVFDVPTRADLCLYPDHTVHISFIEVKEWIQWRLHAHQCTVETAVHAKGWPDERVQRLVLQARKATELKQQQQQQQQQQPDADTVDIEDLDQIWDIMPPCVNKMLERRRFPLDGERTMLVPMLKRGGLSVGTVGRLLESLNDKGGDVRRRFDYVNYYQYNTKIACLDMAQYCPYVARETLDAPRTKLCHDAFIANTDAASMATRDKDAVMFCGKRTGGPHNLILWKLRSQK